jgi:hypothetical protein
MTQRHVERSSEIRREAFVSKLAHEPQRFLAYVLEHSFRCGRRTPEDFLRHFPPASIMDAFRDKADLRAQVLVLTTGVKMKIAIKKSASSAGEDLQIALNEGETDAESILTLLDPDDLVKHLDNRRIWAFITEGEFWNAEQIRKIDLERAMHHTAFILDRALSDRLLTHQEIIEGLTVETLVDCLPKPDLGKVIKAALENAHVEEPFTDQDLLSAVNSSTLVEHVPLAHIWREVIIPKVAETYQFVDASAKRDMDDEASTRSSRREARAAARATPMAG